MDISSSGTSYPVRSRMRIPRILTKSTPRSSSRSLWSQSSWISSRISHSFLTRASSRSWTSVDLWSTTRMKIPIFAPAAAYSRPLPRILIISYLRPSYSWGDILFLIISVNILKSIFHNSRDSSEQSNTWEKHLPHFVYVLIDNKLLN